MPADPVDLARLQDVVDALHTLQAACTCTPDSDIRDCPNYVEGDEEVLDD